MKIKLLTVALLFSANLMAGSFEKVEAQKYTDSVDRKFIEECIDDLKPHDLETYECSAFKAPEGTRILKDRGFIASIKYIAQWSYYRCKDRGYGQLYVGESSSEITLIAENPDCLREMAKSINGDKGNALKNKSVYLIAE